MTSKLLLSTLPLFVAGIAHAKQACTGCTPLNDLGAGLYLGQYEGGLYSGGLNTPPPAHRAAALAEAAAIEPLDDNGAPDPDGLIGLISISMSNCNQEFSAFERRADLDGKRGAQLRVVGGCQGGQALDTISNPNAAYWSNLEQRIAAAGLSPEQVQATWIKMADAQPATTTFPDHALAAQANAVAVLQILRASYPNLRLAFFSSRTYGGYTTNPLRGEPLSYETGFAVKWLIEDQIAGDPDLNYDPQAGAVVSPLVLWGPYLWANGTIPRSDGLVWLPGDFEGDGVHPSEDGEQKVAGLLEAFFQFDPFATPWYGAPTERRLWSVDAVADAGVDGSQPGSNFGSATTLPVAGSDRLAFLKFDTSGIPGTLEGAKLSLRTPPGFTSQPGAQLWGVSDTSWQESTITFANAPAVDGAFLGELPVLSRGTATSFDVTDELLASWGGFASFALTTDAAGGAREFLSREGGEAPRLVLTVRPPCSDPAVPYCRSGPNTSGNAATITTSGSASEASNDLGLVATGLPSGVPALFFYGPTAVQIPFGQGLRCVGGGIARLGPPEFADAGGTVQRALDFTTSPLGVGPRAVDPGDRVHFQCWFRDVSGGPAGFDLSDGCQIVVCP